MNAEEDIGPLRDDWIHANTEEMDRQMHTHKRQKRKINLVRWIDRCKKKEDKDRQMKKKEQMDREIRFWMFKGE